MFFVPHQETVTLLFQILEAIKAKRPKINPEINPIIGPVISIISLGCLERNMLDICSNSFG
jgi:hypothetical protein